ncbi:MAG TPA: LuxR C-terminal-related transcriptional regulator [Dehalococcoidia bacterium]|nr:LuxR C-terminal-related transcriptional regulator [Dehalococcoidia bacterium]
MGPVSRRGRPPHPDVLTPAEWQVLNFVRHGMSNRQIARKRNTSLDAVKFHIANLLIKLDAADRGALRAWPGAPYDSAMARRECTKMPERLQLGPIGQIGRHTTDIKRAEAWYRDVLGLPHLFTFGNLAFFDCNGTRLFISTGENGGERHDESCLHFQVPDINAAFEELKSRGVKFQGAPHMIHRHENGVEEWMAFFEDPDGGPLALMARVG